MTVPRRIAGFTLIELMIAMVIIALLAAVALPSYNSYIRKGRRAEGQSLLQAAQLAQEKYRINSENYAGSADLTSSNTAFARVCSWSGTNCMSQNGNYELSILASSTSGFTMRAVPQGDQANDSTCSYLEISQNSTSVTYSPTGCWSN